MKDFLCELTINQWLAITPIILSVVSVVIAIWSSRSTAKMMRKQINAIKDVALLQIGSTQCNLQLESVKVAIDEYNSRKKLAEIQKELTLLQKDSSANSKNIQHLREESKKLNDNIIHLHNLQMQIGNMSFKLQHDRSIVNKGR